jgi:DNA-directed RNA polymerase subunit RPC12/RpoP
MALISLSRLHETNFGRRQACPYCGYRLRIKNQKPGIRLTIAVVMVVIGIHLVMNGAAMPGGFAIFFGFFMALFGAVVIVATLWKIITS